MGHPQGLFYLFFAELWERFSFYGMRALLVLYLSNDLFKDLAEGKEVAYEIYAAYGALVYFTPAIGGMIADRLIGHKNSILLGAILMCIGHFVMAFPNEYLFYAALGLLIIGNGFFKPNISSMVGGLYKQGDVRRDAGFTIFYMGINVGAFLAPLACGYLGIEIGWHWGFGAAGIGMLAGLIVFWRGIKKNIYGDQGHQPKEWQDKKVLGMNVRSLVWVVAFLAVPLFAYLVNQNQLAVPGIGMGLLSTLLWALLIAVMIYIVYLMVTKLSKQEAGRIAVVVVLTFFITIFWAFFEQAGSSLTLFAEEQVNLKFLNASQTNSINPGYIMILAIPFSMMWRWLAKKKKNPITPVKFSLAILQLGIGFLFFAISMNYMDEAGMVPMFFLMIGYFFVTTGELFASPIGLSKVTELAPVWLVAFMMGVWFLSSAFAHYIAGGIAKLTVTKPSTEYVMQEGLLVGFAETLTGTDQNAMGQFAFEFNKAYTALSDTNIHQKEVSFLNEETKETHRIQLYTYAGIADSIANMNGRAEKGSFAPQDTVLTLDQSMVEYPSAQQMDTYLSTLELMKPVNTKWDESSVGIISDAKAVKASMQALQAYSSPDQKRQYHRFQNFYYEVQGSGEVNKAYKMILERDEKTEAEWAEAHGDEWAKMEKLNAPAIARANDYIAFRSQMAAADPNFAEATITAVETLHANRNRSASLLNLGNYTKVFAMIGLISLITALVAMILAPLLKKGMSGIH